MKSFVFNLKFPEDAPDRWLEHTLEIPVPILPAFAIEYCTFTHSDALNSNVALVEGKDFELVDDTLVWRNFKEPFFDVIYRLTIHHHGIRDYALLFPHVEDLELKERLGRFYQEAETSFDNGNWLCFALMCGALYEGLLYSHFKENLKFNGLIEKAKSDEIVDADTVKVMHSARVLRNLVHANRCSSAYVSRLQAMDMRKVMDRLIRMEWK